MARKNLVPSYTLKQFSSLAANATSESFNVQNLDNLSIHLEFTGTPTGTVTVEARNGSDDDWYTLTLGGGAIAMVGAAGDHQIFLTMLPFTDIRLQYAYTSGTGAITAAVTAKTVGA